MVSNLRRYPSPGRSSIVLMSASFLVVSSFDLGLTRFTISSYKNHDLCRTFVLSDSPLVGVLFSASE
jgi:hypothetical protein